MAYDPETGLLYANSNRYAFRTRLIPHWRLAVLDQLHSWENWMYAAGSLLVLLLLVRRRPSPGWPGGVVVAGLLVGACFAAVKLPPERQHFGREIAPQRGTPYAAERAPLEMSMGCPARRHPGA